MGDPTFSFERGLLGAVIGLVVGIGFNIYFDIPSEELPKAPFMGALAFASLFGVRRGNGGGGNGGGNGG